MVVRSSELQSSEGAGGGTGSALAA